MIRHLAFLIFIVWSAGTALAAARKPAAQRTPAPKTRAPKPQATLLPRATKDELLFKKAVAMAQKGKTIRSKKILFSLTKKYPQNGLYWFNLGNIYFMSKEFENATRCYRNVIFIKSPLSPAAEVYLAKTYLTNGAVRDALPVISNLEVQQLPPGLMNETENLREELLEKIRSQAILSYQARRNDETIDLLTWANKTYPRAEHLMLIGMTWLRVGKPKRARTAFQTAKDFAKDPAIIEEATNFLKQIREGTWDADRLFFPYVDLSAGYNSNVFNEAENQQSKLGYKIATGGTGHLYRGETFFANLRYRVLWEEYDQLVEDQFLTYTVSSQLIHDKDNLLFELTPRFQHQFVDQHSHLYKPGAFFRVQKRFEASEYGLTLDFGAGRSTQDETSYLAGNTFSATVFWNSFGPASQWTVFLFGEREDVGSYEPVPNDRLPLAFSGYGPGLRATWFPTDAWDISGGGTYSLRGYRPVELPNNIQRNDYQASLWTRLNYRLDKDISVYVSGDMVHNKSTLDASSGKNKNYSQWSVFGGTTWELSF